MTLFLKILTLTFFTLAGLVSSPAFADDQAKSIIRETMRHANSQRVIRLSTLQTCRYIKKGKRLSCATQPQTKKFFFLQQTTPQDDQKKSVMLLQYPPSEKGIGILQYDYLDQEKPADQWIYLTSIGKVKRIVTTTDASSGTLFGSEISYSDLAAPKLEHYDYSIKKEVIQNGKKVWVIEQVAKSEYADQTPYSKQIKWVDQATHVVLKVALYDKNNKPQKLMVFQDHEPHKDILVAQRIVVTHLQNRRQSTLTVEQTWHPDHFPDHVFSQRILNDAAFQQQVLQKLSLTDNAATSP